MKKRKVILTVVLAVLLIGMITGVAVYVNKPPKETKWNVRIWVENASKSELILHMERNDENGEVPELMTGDSFALERWTPIGWMPVKMKEGIGFNSVGIPIGRTYSNKWKIALDLFYGNLPMGLYRISKSASINGEYIARTHNTYYAPFVLTSWWEILLAIIFIAILVCLIWYRSDMFDKMKVKIPKWKFTTIKKPFVVGIVITVVGIGVIWGTLDYFAAHITNAMHGLEVSAEEASDRYVKGTILYGDGKYRLSRPNTFTIEKKEGLIWSNVTPLYPENMSEELVPTMSMNVRINWSSYYGPLLPGTYRIKQAFEIRDIEAEGEPVVEKGYYYITFTRE